MPKGNHVKPHTAERERKPPTMNRSARQLATGYAPGALFTWEGGLGSCKAHAILTEKVELETAARDAIREQIQEYLESWLERGLRGEYGGNPPSADRLVDGRTFEQERPKVSVDRLDFMSARGMGYEPFPLTFVCRTCGLYASSRDVHKLASERPHFAEGCRNLQGGSGCKQDWEQIDVVFVHWSGSVEPLSPSKRFWNAQEKKIDVFDRCESCGHDRYRLTRPSNDFSSWRFECVNCGVDRQIVLADEFTFRLLGDQIASGSALRAEANMEPVSYRASSAFYPHSDKVLLFRESEWLSKLQPHRADELTKLLAAQYGYPGRTLTDGEKESLLTQVGRRNEWDSQKALLDTVDKVPEVARKALEDQIAINEARWAREVFTSIQQASASLAQRCSDRTQFVRRFDPIRMAVEHRTLSEEKLKSSATTDDGKQACVDVTDPDRFLLPDAFDDRMKGALVDNVRRALRLMGIAEMNLIRDLKVCDYSFGFSRVGSSPTVKRPDKARDRDLPVRLNMFEWVKRGETSRFPVYCQQQANEAFYVRLDESTVRAWLAANGIAIGHCPSERLGGLLIEEYRPFDRFVTEFRKEGEVDREGYPYVYTLLHTLAHHMMDVMSELSGLEIGSFGEHLFVPDLALLVYRRGVTMDLGNLSSMWRNHGDPEHGNDVLYKMLMPETLRCGSETICMGLRGGACPDCVMIPETTCLTRNELLSRSVLIGRGVPRWDRNRSEIVGYFNLAAGRASQEEER